MKSSPAPQQLSFHARLERIAQDVDYFALSVPATITRALGTHSPVSVSAQINDGTPFLVSLYPRGGGRHGLRVKAKVRLEAKIKEGDRVRAQITVIDRSTVSIPPDLTSALRAQNVLESFKALTPGKRNYTIRWIDEAAKPETREKRIRAAVAAASQKS